MKNSYALKLQEQKTKERLMWTHKTVVYMNKIFTLALNKEGMGKERIGRISGYTNELNEEYMQLLDTDAEYANAKLDEAYEAIMGRRFEYENRV